jgi:hypothetical protein
MAEMLCMWKKLHLCTVLQSFRVSADDFDGIEDSNGSKDDAVVGQDGGVHVAGVASQAAYRELFGSERNLR